MKQQHINWHICFFWEIFFQRVTSCVVLPVDSNVHQMDARPEPEQQLIDADLLGHFLFLSFFFLHNALCPVTASLCRLYNLVSVNQLSFLFYF